MKDFGPTFKNIVSTFVRRLMDSLYHIYIMHQILSPSHDLQIQSLADDLVGYLLAETWSFRWDGLARGYILLQKLLSVCMKGNDGQKTS